MRSHFVSLNQKSRSGTFSTASTSKVTGAHGESEASPVGVRVDRRVRLYLAAISSFAEGGTT